MMPTKRLCRWPGCRVTVGAAAVYCATHAALRRRQSNRLAQARWRQAHPDAVRAAQRELRRRQITFQNKALTLPENPRMGICARCGDPAASRQHALHHERYDPADPLAHTTELCARCHAREHHPRDPAVSTLRESCESFLA